jgi:hypothetical protein
MTTTISSLIAIGLLSLSQAISAAEPEWVTVGEPDTGLRLSRSMLKAVDAPNVQPITPTQP